ncbi:MAG: DUF389 domain-containing protein [Bacteriovoracia bacterium]
MGFSRGNVWLLVFAILICSIGLNVNSTAVVIGAMLISPLMGPIVGAGLGLGIWDTTLIKHALRNLSIAIVVSIVTSFFYFLLSPLGDAQTEILARTRPTAFDVLIAIFGGATGIIAAAKTEKGTAVPGVAIATALMPPLCTAGYGLASGKFGFFFGALYLFFINCTYIALTTYVAVRVFRFGYVDYIDPIRKKKVSRITIALAVVTMIPSIGLAWFFVREGAFRSRVQQFVKHEFDFPGTHVMDHEVLFSLRKKGLEVRLIGNQLSESDLEHLKSKLSSYNLTGTELKIVQSTLEETLEKKISEKLNAQFSSQLNKNETTEKQLNVLQSQLLTFKQQGPLSEQITNEVTLTMPYVRNIYLTYFFDPKDETPQYVALVNWKYPQSKNTLKKLERLLRVRLNQEELELHEIR